MYLSSIKRVILLFINLLGEASVLVIYRNLYKQPISTKNSYDKSRIQKYEQQIH